VIVRLPSERVVVIDAKVPLAAYLDAIEAGDEYARDHALGKHLAQVRSHVQRLAARGYASEIEQTAEFVVLFIPNDSFLAAAKGVSIGIAFQRRLGVGLFGGEGFIMERLQGDGWLFVHAGGTLLQRELKPGETLRIDTGCIVAFQPSVSYDIQYVGKIKSALFGGEGLFFATLRGPGHVWLQSLPLSRMANRIIAAAPGALRGGREEGSILGGLGGILDGDNS